MKKLLLTTILVSAFAGAPLLAQTTDPAAPADSATLPNIAAPEGFARQDIILTAENLLGATIYDANGDSIGDVHDLVLDTSAADTGAATGTGTPPGNASGATGTQPQADGGTTGTGMPAGDAGVATPETGTGTDAAGTAPAATPPADSTATDSTATEGTGADSATIAPDGTMTENTAGAPTAGGNGADATAQGMPTDGTAEAGAASPSTGQITHAVLDIGGFLGIGEHRVAVPISDLAIYGRGDETRVYLPWTREQLEALPDYDANDPATLGRSSMPTAD